MTIATLAVAALFALPAAEELRLVREGADALDRWDLPAAQAAIGRLEKESWDSVEAMEAMAVLRFHEGRYAEAVKLLDVIKAKGRKEDRQFMPKLIRQTAAITKDFQEKRGKHFVVKYHPGGPDEILADWALETLEAQRAALEQDLGYVPPEVVPLEIYPTGDSFASVTTLTRKEIETSGTIALCKFNRLMITSPGALAYGYGWRDTIAHEYTHYVVARMTGNKVPIWLHEGLAKYEEVRWRRSTGGEKNPTVETVLAEGLRKNYFISFDRMHPSIAKLPSSFDATLAFAEVENLIGYVVDAWKYEGVRTLLDGLRDDKPMDVALLGAFGVGLKGLEEKWRANLAANPPKLNPKLELMPTALKDPDADPEASGAAHKGMSEEARDRLRLGDLLAGEQRAHAAAAEYRRAKMAEEQAKGGQYGPMFDYKIAELMVITNSWPEAKKTLGPMLDTYPTFAPGLKLMGKYELNEARNPKKARELFEQTLWQSPFDTETYALLGEACEKLGDKACLERAKRNYLFLLKQQRM